MRRSGAATAAVAFASALARTRMPRPDSMAADGLLVFPFQARQPRDAAPQPGLAPPPEPDSIKEAIIRWLDEQL